MVPPLLSGFPPVTVARHCTPQLLVFLPRFTFVTTTVLVDILALNKCDISTKKKKKKTILDFSKSTMLTEVLDSGFCASVFSSLVNN